MYLSAHACVYKYTFDCTYLYVYMCMCVHIQWLPKYHFLPNMNIKTLLNWLVHSPWSNGPFFVSLFSWKLWLPLFGIYFTFVRSGYYSNLPSGTLKMMEPGVVLPLATLVYMLYMHIYTSTVYNMEGI